MWATRPSSLATIALLGGLIAACAGPQRVDERIMAARIAEPSAPVSREVTIRSGPVRVASPSPAGGGEDAALHTELIRGLLEQGQFYAAIAHIEAQRGQGLDSPELRWLEADARRRLRQFDQAEALYRSLLRGPYGAQAEHGLGLIAAQRGQAAQAIAAFERAVRRAPTRAEFRNDLGYAYLNAGRFEEALIQLATATELAPGDARARGNLVLLLLVTGDRDRARAVAETSNLPPERFTRLEEEAQNLRERLSSSAVTGGRSAS